MNLELQAPFRGSTAQSLVISSRRTGFDPGRVQVKFVADEVTLLNLSSQYFGIPFQYLSKTAPYSYASSSRYNSLLEGQAGEVWAPSNKAVLFDIWEHWTQKLSVVVLQLRPLG
jgi:hypothetical protein